MARAWLTWTLALCTAGCSIPAKKDDQHSLPRLHRTRASHHFAGMAVARSEEPLSRQDDEDPQESLPTPSFQQVEQAIRTFQVQRATPGPSMDTAWEPFLRAVSDYLDNPPEQLVFSPLIRARVAAEFELDAEQRRPGGAPEDLERAVGSLISRIDLAVHALRGGPGGSLARPDRSLDGKLAWPLASGLVTSGFGKRIDPFQPERTQFHSGLDLATLPHEPVYAAEQGVVALAGWAGRAGNTVRIDHDRGAETVYAHLSTILVEPGQEVAQGEVIGLVGRTGRTTGHHLHFALYIDGQAVNPLDHLRPLPLVFSDTVPGIVFGYGEQW